MDFHLDSWVSTISGVARAIGQKMGVVSYQANTPLSQQELSDLYRDSFLAAKICNAIPEDATRQGWYRKGIDPDADKAIRGRWSELELVDALVLSWVWGRLFGGGLLLLGFDDGQNEIQLRPDSRARLSYVKDIDCRYVSVATPYSDPRSPNYGKPEIYRINDVSSPLATGREQLFHESRTIRFGGARTTVDRRLALNGWDDSILIKCYDVIKTHGVTWTAVANAVLDSTLVVYKRKNLKDMIADGNELLVQQRLQLIELGRTIARALLIDMDDEEIERQVLDLSGYPKIVEIDRSEVCSAAEMPEMLLFGKSPSGLAASGDNEMRGYYDRVRHAQTTKLAPKIDKLDAIFASELGIDLSGSELIFNPLWNTTDAEDAAYDLTRSQAIGNYIDRGVFAPEEITEQVADELSLEIDKSLRPGYLEPGLKGAINE